MHKRVPQQRSGFTLIEILVVIAIIGILAALTLQATSTFIDTQRQSNTENLIKTVMKTLEVQNRSVLLLAEKEPVIPQRIVNMARVTPPPFTAPPSARELQRARVIYKILRLKQEFPMNFTEALHPAFSPFTAPPLTAAIPLDPMPPWVPFPINDPPPGALKVPTLAQYTANQNGIQEFVLQSRIVSGRIVASDFPPKAGYVAALSTPTIPTPSINDQATENAICLLLALQEKNHGITLPIDNIANQVVTTPQFPASNPWNTPNGTNPQGLKAIADGWGTPLIYFRYPRSGPDSPLTGSTAASATTKSAVLTDPLDPEGLLSDPQWNNVVNFQSWQGVYWFEWYGYQVHVWPDTTNPKTYSPIRPVHSLPVVVSAGKNGSTTDVPSQSNPPPWYITAKLGMGLITRASNTNPIVITSAKHRLDPSKTNRVVITGVTGNRAANGTWTVTVTGPDTFSIPANGVITPANAAYAGGGMWSLPAENDNIYSWKLRMTAATAN